MAIIIFAIFLTLLQSGIAQYIEHPYKYIAQLPEPIQQWSHAVPETPITHMKFPTPTTIITDCTPSVCHNLGNLVQLMIVSNLLQNTNIGSTATLKMALPIIKEALSSPSLANICPDSLKRKFNLISSRIPNTPSSVQNQAPNIAIPNLEVKPKLFLSNDLLTEVPNLNTLPNLIYQNLPSSVSTVLSNVPFNTLQNLPLEITATRPFVDSLPPNIIYQNVPLPISTVSNNIPLNTILQNFGLPIDILETRAAVALPPNIVHQNLPLNTISSNIPINTVLPNIPAKIVFKSSPYERIDPTPNFIFQNTPINNLDSSSSLPFTIFPNTKAVKFLIRS